MSHLTVRETARLVSAVKCSSTHAIHRKMFEDRHKVLLQIVRQRFGAIALPHLPPLDFADPGDLYVIPQVISLSCPPDLTVSGPTGQSSFFLASRVCVWSLRDSFVLK
jgi:hypothetical protein